MDGKFGIALVLSALVWILWFQVLSPKIWPPAPRLAAMDPQTAPAAGGVAFTIAGANFERGATVQFGDLAATELAVAATA